MDDGAAKTEVARERRKTGRIENRIVARRG
jgi:hypothetical protein